MSSSIGWGLAALGGILWAEEQDNRWVFARARLANFGRRGWGGVVFPVSLYLRCIYGLLWLSFGCGLGALWCRFEVVCGWSWPVLGAHEVVLTSADDFRSRFSEFFRRLLYFSIS